MINICDFFNLTLKEREDRVNFRDKVMDATGWKYTTFYYKMRTGRLSVLERRVVKEIVDTFKYCRP